MPATLVRGDTDRRSNSAIRPVRPVLSPERKALAAAIQATRHQERERQKLQAALIRAADQWAAQSAALRDKERLLSATRDKETARSRQAFIEGRPDVSPLPQAEAAVAEARDALTETEALQADLEQMVERAEREVAFCRSQVDQRVGELLAASPQVAALGQALRAAFLNIRTLKGIFRAIGAEIPHAAPHKELDGDWVEPMTPVPPDAAAVAQWVAAVQLLHQDAEAPLPEV